MTRLVFVGSTSRDLPDEREAVRTACDELGLAVVDMKDFPATGAGATAASLAQLDRAGVYVGVFARRYGYVEPGYAASVTECEYDHAGTRGLARLCFLLHPSAAWPDERVEHAALDRLAAFQERIARDQVVRWFVNPHDLRHQVYRALEHWLRQQGERRGPCSLAMPAADFVGREDDLAELELQHAAGVAISGVQGQGGVGKTELARKLAERLASRCPDGLIEIDLRGVDPVPIRPCDAQARIVREFRGVDHRVPDDDAALLAEYRATLAGKRVLLLLDNAGTAEQVEALLPPAGTPAVVIVTSRRRLAVKGLRRHDLDTLPADAASALVRSLVPQLSDAEATDMAQACGRLPLALRLAGSALAERPDWTAADYLRRLQTRGRLNVLDGVWLVVAESEDLLADATKVAWSALAVFAGGFEKGWAAQVWAVDEDTADDYLGELQRHSLLAWEAEERRFHLHDLVREYATGRLDPSGRDLLELRHAALFRDELRSANLQLKQGGDHILVALRRFEAVEVEARVAFDRARGQPDAPAWQVICRDVALQAAGLLDLRLLAHEQVDWYAVAADRTRRLGDRRSEAYARVGLGIAYFRLGQVRLAVESYENGLALAREVGDRRIEGNILGCLGTACLALGRPREAIPWFRAQLGIAQGLGDRRGEGSSLGSLGLASAALGQPAEALSFYERRLTIARALGDRRGEGIVLGNLGNAYGALGRFDRAIECHEARLRIARELGDRQGEGNAIGNLGKTYRQLGQPHRAIDLLQRRLELAREIGDRRGEGGALLSLGLTYADLGQPRQAIDCFRQSLAIDREIGNKRGAVATSWGWGCELVKLGQIAQALPLLEFAVEYHRAIGRPDAEAYANYVASLRQRLAAEQPPA